MKMWINLAFVGLLHTGCSEEISTEEVQQEWLVGESSFDMLRFGTEGELNEFIAAHNDMDLLEVAQLMYDEKGYLSLLLMYNMDLAELDDIGLDTESIPLVHSHDDMLHLLLNRNAELEIAGYTMRVDEDFVFKFRSGNIIVPEFLADYADGRVEIEKGQTVLYNEDLTVYMHNNDESIAEDIAEDVNDNDESIADDIPEDVIRKRLTVYDYFTGGKYRMKSKQFNGYWFFYSAIGSSTKVQMKKRYWFFGWRYRWATVKRYNRLKYELKYNLDYLSFPDQVQSASSHNYCFCNIARDTYSWSTGTPAPIIYSPVGGSGESVHWAHEFSVSPNTEHRTINY